MFDFQDLFLWDRFNEPAWTETGREQERSRFIGQVRGRRVSRRHDGGGDV